jgi:hypothetical protein
MVNQNKVFYWLYKPITNKIQDLPTRNEKKKALPIVNKTKGQTSTL